MKRHLIALSTCTCGMMWLAGWLAGRHVYVMVRTHSGSTLYVAVRELAC